MLIGDPARGIQSRHLIPALNARAARAQNGYGCMDNLTAERSFDSQATWVIGVFGLFSDI